MDGFLQLILTSISVVLGAAIMFLAGAVYATPAEDPNKIIEYLKARINMLETRENMRILEDRELMLEMVHGEKKKDGQDKKQQMQTKWVG